MNNDEKKKNDGFANGVTLIVIGVCIMPINRWVKMAVILFLVAVGLVAYNHKTEHVTKVINKMEMRSSHFNDCD